MNAVVRCIGGLAMAAALLPCLAMAQYGGDGGGAPPPAAAGTSSADNTAPAPPTDTPPLLEGGYSALLGTWQKSQGDPVLSTNYGGNLLIGYRKNWHAIEAGFSYTVDGAVQRQAFKLKGLIFPFKSLPTAYAVVGAGLTRFNRYPVAQPQIPITGYQHFVTGDLMGGVGYMLPLHLGRYDFAIRAEAMYQLGDRFIERYTDFQADIPAPSTFRDVVINVGLQLPLRRRHADVPAAAAPPPAVVPLEAAPASAPASPTPTDGGAAAPPAKGGDSDAGIDSILGPAPPPAQGKP